MLGKLKAMHNKEEKTLSLKKNYSTQQIKFGKNVKVMYFLENKQPSPGY